MKGLLIAIADQRLAPGFEEDPNALFSRILSHGDFCRQIFKLSKHISQALLEVLMITAKQLRSRMRLRMVLQYFPGRMQQSRLPGRLPHSFFAMRPDRLE